MNDSRKDLIHSISVFNMCARTTGALENYNDVLANVFSNLLKHLLKRSLAIAVYFILVQVYMAAFIR